MVSTARPRYQDREVAAGVDLPAPIFHETLWHRRSQWEDPIDFKKVAADGIVAAIAKQRGADSASCH
jgi:hypothetical protein